MIKPKLLGIPIEEQTPEQYHSSCKDVAVRMNIKKPEAPIKTRKAKGVKNDRNTKSKSSTDNPGEAQKDAQNLQNGGWSDSDRNKFLFTFPNQ